MTIPRCNINRMATLLVVLLLPNSVLAYSGFGHMLICEIAYREIQLETRDTLDSFVSAHGEYSTFNEACKYADRFPRKFPESHYANFARGVQTIESNRCEMSDECIFTGIDREIATLSNINSSNEEKGEAAILLGHWLGDLHQPLHISFKDDRGGNLVLKSGVCSAGSLHAVWDKCIVEREVAPKYGLKEGLGYSESGRINRAVTRLEKSISDDDRIDWISGDWFEWANESLQITLHPKVGYCVRKRHECWYDEGNKKLHESDEPKVIQMTDSYLKLWAPVVEQRIKKAGVRLAHILDQLL